MKWTHLRNEKPKEEPKRYCNCKQHPEYQDIQLEAGFKSVQLKQMEILEQLLRAQIEIQITSLPKDKRVKMLQKYKDLI